MYNETIKKNGGKCNSKLMNHLSSSRDRENNCINTLQISSKPQKSDDKLILGIKTV